MTNVIICGPLDWAERVSDKLLSSYDVMTTIVDSHADVFSTSLDRRTIKKGDVFLFDMDDRNPYTFILLGVAYALDLTVVAIMWNEPMSLELNYVYDQIIEDWFYEEELIEEIGEYI